MSWGGTGWLQDDSSVSRMHKRAWIWVHAPPPSKILNLDPLRLLLTQSGARLLFNTCDKTNEHIFHSEHPKRKLPVLS